MEMLHFQAQYFELKKLFCFFKKVFVFQKTCFKVKVMKMFKISSDCHIKKCLSFKRRAILKILSTFFRGTYVLCCVDFKIKSLQKTFPSGRTKTNSHFAVKFIEHLYSGCEAIELSLGICENYI